jgi:hypothetical protein
MQVTFTFLKFSLLLISIEAADAREPVGQDTAVAAERMSVLNTPMVNTAVVADCYSFVDKATTVSQVTWLATSVIASQLRQVTTRNGRELIAAWQLPTSNVANIHAALRPIIEVQWHHVRPSADSDTEDHSYSCIAADNRRRHMRRVAGVAPLHVPPREARPLLFEPPIARCR